MDSARLLGECSLLTRHHQKMWLSTNVSFGVRERPWMANAVVRCRVHAIEICQTQAREYGRPWWRRLSWRPILKAAFRAAFIFAAIVPELRGVNSRQDDESRSSQAVLANLPARFAT